LTPEKHRYFHTPRVSVKLREMIHENLSSAIETLSARIITIRDSL